MWSIEATVQSGNNSDLISSLGESLNEIVTVGERRVVAGVYARVPPTIMVLLLAGSALSLAMVGYGRFAAISSGAMSAGPIVADVRGAWELTEITSAASRSITESRAG